MNEYLVAEFKKLGADERASVLASHVYLELCEVKKYYNPKYEYNDRLQTIVIRAKKKPADAFSTFVPIPSYEPLSVGKLQDISAHCDSNSIFLAIVHADSTCIYYEISKGLVPPLDAIAKHLRVNKQEKLDAELNKHRDLIQQAALCGVPITLPKAKPQELDKASNYFNFACN